MRRALLIGCVLLGAACASSSKSGAPKQVNIPARTAPTSTESPRATAPPTTALPAVKVTCPQGVDQLAAGFNSNASDAELGRLELQSIRACGPSNGGKGAAEWETWATTDSIPQGNTDVHDVLASMCADVDHQHSTNVCQDPLLQGIDGN